MVGDLREWYQQEFIFDFSIPKKKKKKVDYKLIISELKKGPLKFSQIQALAGVSRVGVSQVITTLSLHYPLYEYDNCQFLEGRQSKILQIHVNISCSGCFALYIKKAGVAGGV
ncbi:MAG: hypothetical protein K6A15_07210 [Treponema sp.]|nr:hypothetical protein [Treponema sp.]